MLRISFLLLLILAWGCSTPVLKEHASGTDFHMHIHSPPKEYDDLQFNSDRALFAADSINLKRALVLSNAYSRNTTQTHAETENSFIASEVAKSPQKLAGACAVNPAKNWAYAEIKRCSTLGLKVLKLHFMASGIDLRNDKDFEIAQAAIKNAELFGMTIIIHANYPRASRGNEIEKLKELINQSPRVRWIIGHMFGREFDELKGINHKNFLIETSIVPVWMKTDDQRKAIVEAMRAVGINKFVFGSDWPVIHPAETLKALNALPLNEKEKEMILFTNASQLNDLFSAQ